MPRDKELSGYILDGMARGLWVQAYINWATQVEPPPTMGSTWDEMAGKTPAAAVRAAKDLVKVINQESRALGATPLVQMFDAVSRGRSGRATEADRAFWFGEEVALASMGVRDLDDVKASALRDIRAVVPIMVVELTDDGDEMVWDIRTDGVRPSGFPATEHHPTRSNPPDGRRLTPDLADRLVRIRHVAPEMYSDELARRITARVDRALKTGVIDAEVEDTLDAWSDVPTEDIRRIEEAEPFDVKAAFRQNPPGDLEVLVVEDEETLQKLYPKAIRRMFPPAKVFVVDNYDAAIGYLKTHDIKLVISDVDIVGDRSGIDVFEWVKANQPHLVDKYVFVTGGNPHVANIHYRYTEKPFTQAELYDTIRKPAPAARTQSRSTPPASGCTGCTQPSPRATPRAAAPAQPMDPAAFAAAVHEAIALVREQPAPSGRGSLGRFGPDKVYIAAIWRQLAQDPRFREMNLAQFKRRLIEANRHRLLDLVRADLGGGDPGEVGMSEIEDMGSTFHFVIDRRAPNRQPHRNPARERPGELLWRLNAFDRKTGKIIEHEEFGDTATDALKNAVDRLGAIYAFSPMVDASGQPIFRCVSR